MTEPRPSLRPTNPSTLVVAGLLAAAVAWFLISEFYGSIPALPWIPAVTLALLALFEFVLANNTRARIARKPGRPPVEPLLVARYVVLAKASSLAGAIFAGFTGGMLVWLLTERARLAAAATDLPPAIGSFLASLALIAAALWLEHACRVPKQPDDKDESDEGRTGEPGGRPANGKPRSN
ncbi:MAG: DUF3180 domain-containing protein [Hamadaea sp.]|nr:DUF3180 domain-containing protein [Hamadaea sp.]